MLKMSIEQEQKIIERRPISESETEELRQKSLAEIDHFLTDPAAGYKISRWARQERDGFIFNEENEKQHAVERALYHISVFSFPDLFNRAKMEEIKATITLANPDSK